MIAIGPFRIGKYIFYEKENNGYPDCTIDLNVKLLRTTEQIVHGNLQVDIETMSQLLGKNVSLFVYFENGKPLGMMCGCKGSCYIRGPGIPLIQSDDTVYWFWIYTLPEARGKNVYTKLKHAFFSFYRDATHFSALVDPDNTIMCSEMHKLGFVPTRLYSYRKLFTISLLTKKNVLSSIVMHSLEIGNRHNLLVI